MTATTTVRAHAPDDLDDGFLASAIARLLVNDGASQEVAAVRREPFVVPGRSPAEVVFVTFSDGGKRSLFVKHVGNEDADHPEKQRRDREVRIYEDVLTDEELPAPAYFGSAWNHRTQRRDVFLEYVPDWDLRYQELDHWFTAAGRLAQLHAYFAARADRLLQCEFLLRFDARNLHGWAERALRTVHGYDAGLAGALEPVVRHYDRVASVIGRQPPTLVHNDLAPKNVLVDRSRSPARVAFVDWEQAGIGCCLLDLVVLKYGLRAESDAAMRRAYRESLAGTGLLPTEDGEVERLFAACELHRTVHRLAHAASWSLPTETVRRWIADANTLLTQV